MVTPEDIQATCDDIVVICFLAQQCIEKYLRAWI